MRVLFVEKKTQKERKRMHFCAVNIHTATTRLTISALILKLCILRQTESFNHHCTSFLSSKSMSHRTSLVQNNPFKLLHQLSSSTSIAFSPSFGFPLLCFSEPRAGSLKTALGNKPLWDYPRYTLTPFPNH